MTGNELVAGVLVVVGLLLLVGAWALHWMLRLAAVVLIAVGIYVLLTGGLPAL
jgi:hypothetical protein